MSTMTKKPNPNEDAGTDLSLYVLFGSLVTGFVMVLGYLVYSFFE